MNGRPAEVTFHVFNDAILSNSDYIVYNERMVEECRIGRYVEGSGSGLTEGTIQTFAWEE
jgi:hypothetical protein